MPNKQLITGQKITLAKLEQAIEMRREMTPAERRLWARLRAGRLGGFHFRRQQVIEPYIVDFYCHQTGIIVEVDGDVHLNQQDRDQKRDQYLQSLGLQVLRFWNSDIDHHLETVLEEILRACQPAAQENSEGS